MRTLSARGDVVELLRLAQRVHPRTYRARRLAVPFARDPAGSPMVASPLPVSLHCLILDSKGSVSGCQSDSSRSVRVGGPWRWRGRWFCGVEYKGVGSKGKPPVESPILHRIEGGIELDMAQYEFWFNSRAARAGVWCQEPLAVYDLQRDFILYKPPRPVRAGIFVRASTSPLRVATLLGGRLLRDYLELRGDSSRRGLSEYLGELGLALGRSIRGLYDIGLVHHTMDASNVSSEGELMDFEPVPYEPEEGVTGDTQPLQVVRSVYAALASYRDYLSRLAAANPLYAKSYRAGRSYFFDAYAPAVSAGLLGEECRFQPDVRTWRAAHELTERFLGFSFDVNWAAYWSGTDVGPVFNALYHAPRNRLTFPALVRASRLPAAKVREVVRGPFRRHLVQLNGGGRSYHSLY